MKQSFNQILIPEQQHHGLVKIVGLVDFAKLVYITFYETCQDNFLIKIYVVMKLSGFTNCRAIALQIKTSGEVDGNVVSSK